MEQRELDLSSRGMEFVNTPPLSSANLRSTAPLSITMHMVYDISVENNSENVSKQKICSHDAGIHGFTNIFISRS